MRAIVAVSRWKNVSVVKYSGRVALDILHAIYQNTEPSNRLNRKYKIYREFNKEFKL